MTTTEPIRVGIAPYPVTEALRRGEVGPAGFELAVTCQPSSEIFAGMLDRDEFDVAEMSLANYLMLRSRGDSGLIGLPVFPYRAFRQSMLWTAKDSGLDISELAGERVAVNRYATTGLVALRGALKDTFGIRASEISWIRTGEERIPVRLPDDIEMEDAIGWSVTDLVREGRADAAAMFWKPAVDTTGLVRLVDDPRDVEREYHRRSGIFPIMHLVVVRRDAYESNPGLATSLYECFVESKRIFHRELATYGATRLATSPWAYLDFEASTTLIGDDLFPYGVGENLSALETALRHAEEQGLLASRLDVEGLFAAELTGT